MTLLLAAVLLRSLVADGYMPDSDGVIRLCTPEGMVAVVIDPDTGEALEVEESFPAECPWAYAFFPAAMPPAQASPAVWHAPAFKLPEPTATAPAPAAVGLPPVRAPPVISC